MAAVASSHAKLACASPLPNTHTHIERTQRLLYRTPLVVYTGEYADASAITTLTMYRLDFNWIGQRRGR